VKVLDDFVYAIISKRRQEPIEHLESKNDLLSRFLCMTDEETGQPFTDKYLRDILLNFVIAGRDTTAILLSWTFYLLTQYPEVEEKVIDEIEDKLHGNLPTWEILKDMPYLKAVLDETLRLYPPVPSNIKQAVQDDMIPGGYFVSKGTEVQFNAYTIHRSKTLWGKDAEEFKPERWLAEDFAKKIHPYQYLPFHAGPRLCLGMNMAFLEAKLIACVILQKFRVRLVPGADIKPNKSLTMPIHGGLPVLLQHRV